ncbi:MAG: hypothetical protein JXP34_21555 [Planctomycetes bacterium]|nr:hypothetical protein [Planctomycetota bacterium]
MEAERGFLISSVVFLASCASTTPPSSPDPGPPDPRALAGEAEPILLATDAFLASDAPTEGTLGPRTPAPRPRGADPSPVSEPPVPVAAIEPAGGAPAAAPAPASGPSGDGFADRLARLQPLVKKRADQRTLRETLEVNQLVRELVSLYFLGRAPDPPLEFFETLDRLDAPSIDVRALAIAVYQSVGLTKERDRAIGDLQRAALGATEFALKEAAFAKEVLGLGSYTPIPADALRAGQSVLIYGELEGLRSRPSNEGRYRRIFRLRLAIVDAGGNEYDRRTYQPKDESAEAIPSVFFSIPYEIPRALAPGEYRLTIEAEDLEGKGRDETEILFRTR